MKTKLLALFLALVCMFGSAIPFASALSNDPHDILFDADYYYAANPDVARAFGKNYQALRSHYESFGKREGRAPSELFDPKVYLGLYPDLKNAFKQDYVAAYNHFVSCGIAEGRQASNYFNVSVYKANYSDLRTAFGSNNLLYLKHYREFGKHEGRSAIKTTTTSSQNTFVDVTGQYAGKTIVIRSVENNKYLSSDTSLANTPLLANRDTPSTWETFTVSNMTKDGWVGFQCYTKKWLTSNINKTDGPVEGNLATSLQSWECYRIYKKGSDLYIKSQANNRYLCVRVDLPNAPVQSKASNASTWERFSITIVNQSSGSSTKVSMALPLMKQNNSAWSSKKIGTKTIGEVGCLTCCISMVYSYHNHTTVNPDKMIGKLKYSNNDLIWSSVSAVGLTVKSVDSGMSTNLLKDIYTQLKNGRPVIIGATTASGGSQHWVVITGYTGSDANNLKMENFTVQDPGSANYTTLKAFLDNGTKADRTYIKKIIF